MLLKKMLRDIRKNLSQFVTIFLMVLIGVMAYTGIEAYMDGMQKTSDKFYSENNLQDLNLVGNNFSNDDITTLKKIDNIKDAERKLSVMGITDNDRTLLINFIEANNISKFYVFEGEKFSKDKNGVWIDNFYASKNNLKVGDTILVKYDNLVLHEKIRGIINVPDHLYDVRDSSELYPDRKEFGVAYLSINEITQDYIKSKIIEEKNIPEDLFDYFVPDFNYKDYLVFNYVMVDVKDKSKIDKTKDLIEEKIDSVKGIVNIEDELSYVTYQGEIDEGKTYVGVFSGLFLFIAMLSVITTMNRIVKKQRIQIGTLKALGFKDSKIIFHYISYGFYISLVAAIVGIVTGYFLIGKLFISMEMSMFEIPNGTPVISFKSYLVSLIVVLVVCFISYLSCKKILKASPADTLRNQIPVVKKGSLNLTTISLFKNLKFENIWNLRDILRNKMRTFMGIAGVVGCCMLIVCAFGMLDSMNHFIHLQFEQLYNFNYKLVLKDDISDKKIENLEKKYGNNTSRTYAIEVKQNGKKEANNILVTDAKNYVRFVNNKGKYINIDSDKGVYITYKLASTKGYKIGDKITWHIYGDKKYYTTKIVGFNKNPQNQNITMTRKYLEKLGIDYKPDAIYTNKNLSNIKEIEGVNTIQDIQSLKDGMTNMLSMMKSMITMIIVVAILLGWVIIYNLGILSYTEKEYQFATLKVLGFSDNKIRKIFVKQNNWIAIVSIIIGLPLGNYLTDFLFKVAIEEHYDFEAAIKFNTYLIATIGTYLVSLVVSKFLARKINNIDMVTSLKGNE